MVSPANSPRRARQVAPAAHDDTALASRPVSYTHLDVYKRQVVVLPQIVERGVEEADKLFVIVDGFIFSPAL